MTSDNPSQVLRFYQHVWDTVLIIFHSVQCDVVVKLREVEFEKAQSFLTAAAAVSSQTELRPGIQFVPFGLHCITLHCIALHCITLHYITLHCIALHCTRVEELKKIVSWLRFAFCHSCTPLFKCSASDQSAKHCNALHCCSKFQPGMLCVGDKW